MRKYIVVLLFIITVLLSSNRGISAQLRYATCDSCGYCPVIHNTPPPINSLCEPISPPGNWGKCVKCLYPGLFPPDSTPDHSSCSTLVVEPTSNAAPTAQPGRQYTMIGCITSEGGFFNNAGSGASSFTQALFDLIVFKMIGGIAFLYLLYGAFIVITSQAEPEKLNHGKRIFYGAIVGLVFVLASVFLVNIIGSNILKIPGFTSVTPTPAPPPP